MELSDIVGLMELDNAAVEVFSRPAVVESPDGVTLVMFELVEMVGLVPNRLPVDAVEAPLMTPLVVIDDPIDCVLVNDGDTVVVASIDGLEEVAIEGEFD